MIEDYVTYAESFIAYFEEQSASEPSFIPEGETAISVVHLMRAHSAVNPGLEEIVGLMRGIDSVDHYDGTGWHGFKNAVRWWLENRGVQL